LKDAGVDPNRTKTQSRGIVSNLRQRQFEDAKDGDLGIEGEGGTRTIAGVKVPVNKRGEVEFYKLRGTKADRLQNAQAELSELEEKHGDMFELMS
jgi:hypothetical protein